MSTCSIPANQPIYQALLNKAAEYPADKPYQAKAYKKAAESVRICNYTLYNGYMPSVPGVGYKIAEFIDNFIQANPKPSQNPPSASYSAVINAILAAPIDQPLTTPQIVAIVKEEASKPINEAHKIAAQNPPRNCCSYHRDMDARIDQPLTRSNNAERAAYLKSLKPVKVYNS